MTAQTSEIVKRLEAREQAAVTLPNLDKGRLGSGFKYYILPEHELPLVKAIIYIKGGSVFDPPGKSGLSAITTRLLREGGTAGKTPAEVDQYLDIAASTVTIGAGTEYLAASVISTTEKFEETMGLLFDMLFTPRFDEGRFELIKKQYTNSIQRRGDDPNTLASVGFDELLYGRTNPWGDYPTVAGIDMITAEDVKALHKRFFHPANMIVGVSGDISAGKVVKLLNGYRNYPEGTTPEMAYPPANPSPVPGVHIVDKDSNQVVFNAGHQGSYRFNPDQHALIVMNDILGGGAFDRILPALIRVEKGLAYSVGSSYRFGPRNAPGTFRVFLATKTASALEALELLQLELKRFAEGEGITEAAIEHSKVSILRRLVFEYTSAFDIVSNVVRFNYYGYPDDYVEEYGRKIGEVSLGDVKKAARKYIHPDELQIVMVGDKAKLEGYLKDRVKYDVITIEE